MAPRTERVSEVKLRIALKYVWVKYIDGKSEAEALRWLIHDAEMRIRSI